SSVFLSSAASLSDDAGGTGLIPEFNGSMAVTYSKAVSHHRRAAFPRPYRLPLHARRAAFLLTSPGLPREKLPERAGAGEAGGGRPRKQPVPAAGRRLPGRPSVSLRGNP